MDSISVVHGLFLDVLKFFSLLSRFQRLCSISQQPPPSSSLTFELGQLNAAAAWFVEHPQPQPKTLGSIGFVR